MAFKKPSLVSTYIKNVIIYIDHTHSVAVAVLQQAEVILPGSCRKQN